MNKLHLMIIVIVVPFLIATTSLLAWDTLEEADGKEWMAVYLGLGTNLHNEHTALADQALRDLRATGFSASQVQGFTELSITDLNASLFRRELMSLETRFDNSTTLLEERSLPRPAHFAGLPDYSHTVYDWINKNNLCPVLPADADRVDLCHEFKGWMGALNSSHFGSLSKGMYLHFHKIALYLAGRARIMREDDGFGADLFGGPAGEYLDYVREAEQEAMIYESFAQHFLQDRWSMGHMWERWNSPDYQQLANKSLLANAEIAAAAGLLHGAQAIFRDFEVITEPLDPMCSPVFESPGLFSSGSVDPVRWITTTATANQKGVGDFHVQDMFNDKITRDNVTYDLFVSTQLDNMMMLSKAGWAEVIRAFGQKDSGLYGIYGINLNESGLPSEGTDTAYLWDAWATNEAIEIGFNRGWVEDVASIVRLVINQSQGAGSPIRVRTCWAAVKWQIWRRNRSQHSPTTSTDLAQGGLGPFGLAFSGNVYALPDYIEPEDFASLPENADTYESTIGGERPGLDKRSIYGFFNRAHTDYWCENMVVKLDALRGSAEPLDQAACEYLADRVYKGTDPDYGGAQLEIRTQGPDGIQGETAEPVCFYFGIQEESAREDLPFYLQPGYVTKDQPDARSNTGYTYQSMANWCARVPVIDLQIDNLGQHSADDRVGAFSGQEEQRIVTLTGHNFGGTTGKVFIDTVQLEAGEITAWTNIGITISLPESKYPKGLDYDLSIQTAEGKDSVGRFILTPPELTIVSVDVVTPITVNTSEGQLTVTWGGNPTFPISVRYRLTPGVECGFGVYGCGDFLMAFTEEQNPLILPETPSCSNPGEPDDLPATLAYEVVITDAAGLTSDPVAAPWTCVE